MKFDFTKEPWKNSFHREYVTTGEPLVSVVTPYYNAHKYFEYLYPCVVGQTFPWFEWIIVDDGSTQEESIAQLEWAEKQDSRIKVVHKENGGISTARNRGIKESKTDIIITLDADELIEPTYFEVLYWALYYNPDYAWAYTESVGFQNQEYVWKREFNAEELKKYNYLVESAAIRKKDILEVGGYDEVEKHYYEDWRLWLKMLSSSKKPISVKGLEFWYRRTDSGILNKVDTNKEIKKKADRLISEAAERVDTGVRAKTFEGNWANGGFVKPCKTHFSRHCFKEKTKTQILFVIPYMTMGGADQFNLDFVRLIDKEKYDVTIITTNPSDNEWKQRFREYTPDIFSLPDFLDGENYTEFISYIIESRQVDICLLSNSYYGYYLVPWLRKEYPEMALIDYVHMEEMYWRNGGYARTSTAMADILEKTYVCNGATERVFVEHFGRKPEDVETVYIGVDYEKFNPEKVVYGEVRKKHEISDQEKVVLFPCRIHEQKRPYLMVDIAKEVVRRNPNVRFLVAGDGPEMRGVRKKVKANGLKKHVIFAGEQKDMLSYYRDSDVTLICSIREGLSLTAYESCSMKTPVITADVGGQKELVNEEMGRVLPMLQAETDIAVKDYSQQEINSYVEAILELLSPENEQRYQRMCEKCRETVINSFGLDSMISHMEAILEECLTEERRKDRVRKAELLRQLPMMTEEMCTIFTAFESKNLECEQIWRRTAGLGQQAFGLRALKKYLGKVYDSIVEDGFSDTCRKVMRIIKWKLKIK